MENSKIRRIIREAIDNLLKDNAFENAVQYVRDNHTWSDAEEQVALERINHYRCDIDFASPRISNEITSLMNEYGLENGLDENWWGGDTDKIFMML